MKLPIVYYGHPLLRKKALPVEHFDSALLELISNMKDTVEAHRGLGLSAPQIGVSRAVFITHIPVGAVRDEDVRAMPPVCRVYINPHIEEVSEDTWTEEEGCLSIPKVYAPVERPRSLKVRVQDEHGVWRTEELSGWHAKVVFHENDHLNGVLFIDRLEHRDRKHIQRDVDAIAKKYETYHQSLEIKDL